MGFYDAQGQWHEDDAQPSNDPNARPLVLSAQQQAQVEQDAYRAQVAANPPPAAIPTPIGTIPSTEALGGPAAIAQNPNMPPPGSTNGAYSPLAPVVGVAPAAPAGTAPVAQPTVPAAPPTQVAPAHQAGPARSPVAPAQPAIIKQEAQDAAAAKDIARRQGANDVEKARANSAEAQDAVNLGEGQARETAAFNEAKNQYLKERADRLEAETDKLANQPIASYWSRLSAGQRIAASLDFALGNAGAALQAAGTGKVVENPAIAQFDKNVQDDLQIQRANFEKSKDIIALRRSNLDEAKQLYQIKSDQLAAKQAAALTQLKAVATARLKNLGMTDAQIAQDATVQTIDQNLHKLQFDTSREIVKDADAHAQSRAAVAASYASADASRAHADYLRAGGAAQAKAAAQAAKDDNTIVFGDDGRPIGRVTSGRGGAQAFATRDADYKRADDQLVALLNDIKTNGVRVYGPEAVSRRHSLAANAAIGVATVSPLGKTNEAMEAEKASIGSSGAYSLLAANPTAVERKIQELRSQREQYRTQSLQPLTAAEAAQWGVQKASPTNPTAPVTPPPGTPFKLRDGRTGTINAQGKHQLSDGTILD